VAHYQFLKRNRYFEVLGGLNSDNRSDNKVGMVIDVDLTEIQGVRNGAATRSQPKPSYTAFLVKAVSLTLREQPQVNRIAIEWPFFKRLVQLDNADVSVAVEKDTAEFNQAVYVASIREPDRKSLSEITEELRSFSGSSPNESDPRWTLMRSVVERVPFVWLSRFLIRFPKYVPSLWLKHRGGAAMISSPSKYGVDTMMATWPWPIGFSFGLVKDRVLAVNGRAEVRPTMSVTLSFDRRLMGGAPAARFFRAVCDKLEDPHRL
jgi:pyruvate/2-oxoglutarate dehydrogenase complex dihydrolipoamide acyltransferase (E2) component